MNETNHFAFPFAVAADGRVQASGGDEAIRGKIIQVLFTARGERVNMLELGCQDLARQAVRIEFK